MVGVLVGGGGCEWRAKGVDLECGLKRMKQIMIFFFLNRILIWKQRRSFQDCASLSFLPALFASEAEFNLSRAAFKN